MLQEMIFADVLNYKKRYIRPFSVGVVEENGDEHWFNKILGRLLERLGKVLSFLFDPAIGNNSNGQIRETVNDVIDCNESVRVRSVRFHQ